MKCTIQSIADELELSRNTVARVLSGKEGVSAKTRKLVLRKAQEMGYGMTAAPLPEKRPPQLPESVVFLTKASTGIPEARAAVIQAAKECFIQQNYSLILAVLEKDDCTGTNSSVSKKEPQLPAVLFNPSIRGILMMDIDDELICNQILRLHLPTAVIIRSDQCPDLTRFAENYHDRLDIIYADSGTYQKRLAAFLMKDQPSSVRFVRSQDNISGIFQEDSLPDFFLCEDDWIAIRLIHTAQASGYSIPEDFSVIGCGNIPESAHIFPALTTIQIPWKQIGTAAARCITDRIHDPELSFVSSCLSSRLIERDSTAEQIQKTTID